MGEKESKRTSETPLGTWVGGAQRGSLWLCYVRALTKKRKSEISSSIDRSRFPGRRTVWKIRKGGRRASDRAKKRVYRFG